MVIDISNLKSGDEVCLAHQYNAVEEDLNFDDCEFSSGIMLTGKAVLENKVLRVNCELSGDCVLVCSRCLNEFSKTFQEPVDLFFEIKSNPKINITDDIREILIFHHQQKVLCSEDCKGICSQCGVDLNNDVCLCKKQVKDKDVEIKENNKFADLKSWRNTK